MMKMSRDTRPPSMLDQPAVSRDQLVGGVLVVLGAHIGLPLAIFAITSLLASTVAGRRPQSFVEEHVVEARFVRKGIKKDPKKLPDRIVPKKSTAPDDAIVVSKNPEPPPDKPKDEKKPDNPSEDLVKRFGDPNQDFAEILERELEGDPNGIEEGTETEAKAGDIYLGQLVSFFKRGWTIPSTLGDTSKLTVRADVEITADCKVGETRIVTSSGEPLFDQSVEDRFQELRSLGTTLPEPPPEIADQFLGKTIGVRFKGQE
jgi:outer membrane biosynthesis protein TonB